MDFSGNDVDVQNMWSTASDENDFITSVLKSASQNEGRNKKKDERKVIVVFELPSGGEVSKYCVGETDDTLEVQVHKHGLMLNPQALLFSGIKIGAFNLKSDGPNTARGGIRLLECSKALRKYRESQQAKQNCGEKNDKDSLSLTFYLPDHVSQKDVNAYSYCFEQKPDPNNRNLQYTIAYFEFHVKEEVVPEDKFNKMSKINFSDLGPNNNDRNSSNSNHSNHGSEGGQSSRSSSHNSQSACGGSSNFATGSSSSSSDNRSKKNTTADKATTSESQQSHQFTLKDIEKTMDEVEREVSEKFERLLDRERSENKIKLKEQQKYVNICNVNRKREMEKQNDLICKQQDEFAKFRKEMGQNKRNYEVEIHNLKNELRLNKANYAKEKEQIFASPRNIQFIPDFQSLASMNVSATPSKRGRIEKNDEENAEPEIKVVGGDRNDCTPCEGGNSREHCDISPSTNEISDFFDNLENNDLSIDSSGGGATSGSSL